MTTSSSGLEALLDDALEDFVLGSDSRIEGAEESCLQKEHDELQKGTKEDFATSKSEEVVSKNVDPRLVEPAKSMAFDPLGRNTGPVKAKGRKPAAKSSQRESQVEQLNQPFAGDSMSRLLSELAKATQGTEYVPPPEQSTDAHLSATLRALADQTPSNSVLGQGGPANRAANEDIILEQLSAQLQAAFQTHPEQSTGEGDLPGMSSLVDTIMQQLLSKDVLYQPMKDIGGRYPEWIEAHRGELSPEDITRYEEQYEYIQRICTLYETNPKDYSHLMDLLNEMQQRGQPPQEIIDELAPGMTFGPDGLPQSSSLPGNDGECCVQ